jgi:hypothetical protein
MRIVFNANPTLMSGRKEKEILASSINEKKEEILVAVPATARKQQ